MIINDDCLEAMKKMEDNSIDFIVTDPPYGLRFMGKRWDYAIPDESYWREMFRILKPGGHLAAMGGSRTFHRLATKIEDSGFEIRDCIMWLYGSGFPKSHNDFGLEGYGTALKPAYEPIILAMKSIDGTYKQNAEKWGIGGINIDESRISTNEQWKQKCQDIRSGGFLDKKGRLHRICESHPKGRWPANLILDKEAAEMLDEQSGQLSQCGGPKKTTHAEGCFGIGTPQKQIWKEENRGASRFFYCAKASPTERNAGLGQNYHPTVKPISLMRYIIKLLAPPNDPLLLDPFTGSGSTLIAAKELGIRYIGIEKETEYCEIAQKRLDSFKLKDQFEFNF